MQWTHNCPAYLVIVHPQQKAQIVGNERCNAQSGARTMDEEMRLAMSILATHAQAAPRAGIFARIADAFRRARTTQAQRTLYQQTLRELSHLSDRELVDLGINPRMIEVTARKAAYKAR